MKKRSLISSIIALLIVGGVITFYLSSPKSNSDDAFAIALPPISVKRFVGIMCYDDLKNSKQTFYHTNRKQANIGDTWYHANGRQANIGDTWYHANGRQANIGDTWYYDNGKAISF